MSSDRRLEEQKSRYQISQKWEDHNLVIFEYGNFCIKILVTLSSTAILSTFAFVGSIGSGNMPKTISEAFISEVPKIFYFWSLSLTTILLAALCTYICHRCFPHIIFLNHKKEFSDLYGNFKNADKFYVYLYNNLVWLGMFLGVVSLLVFTAGVWNLALAFAKIF